MTKAPIYLAWLIVLAALVLPSQWAGLCLVAAACLLAAGVATGGVTAFDSIGVGARLNHFALLMAGVFLAIGITLIVAA